MIVRRFFLRVSKGRVFVLFVCLLRGCWERVSKAGGCVRRFMWVFLVFLFVYFYFFGIFFCRVCFVVRFFWGFLGEGYVSRLSFRYL